MAFGQMTDDERLAFFNNNNAPFGKFLGMRYTLVSKERIEAEMPVTEELTTMPSKLHGGAFMGFADNLGGAGAFVNMPEGATTATIESKTNFFRPVPVGETVKGVATPVNIGRTLQVWRTEIFREDGKLAAVVTQTQIIQQG